MKRLTKTQAFNQFKKYKAVFKSKFDKNKDWEIYEDDEEIGATLGEEKINIGIAEESIVDKYHIHFWAEAGNTKTAKPLDSIIDLDDELEKWLYDTCANLSPKEIQAIKQKAKYL